MKKLTVLYITTSNMGGANNSLLNLIHSVSGHVNPIVVMPRKEGAWEMFVENGIETIVVPFREEIFNLALFRSFSLPRKVLNILGWWRDSVRWNARFCRRVEEKLRKRQMRVNIVHSNTGGVTNGLQLAKVLKAKHVWHLREFQDRDFDSRPFYGWDRFFCKLYASDAAIGITKAVAERFDLLQKHPNGHYLWNAIMPASNAAYVARKENYIFFAAASIGPGKGLHDLLEAYAASSLPGKGIKLHVAGAWKDSAYENEIKTQAERLKINDNIVWLGYRSDLKDMQLHAQAFVMPSVAEGLGRVAVEAMFYGCPVITRNSGGPTEYMRHGWNGLVFETTGQLTEMLEKVCYDDVTNMVMQAQRFAINHFSEETYGGKLLEIYNSIVT